MKNAWSVLFLCCISLAQAQTTLIPDNNFERILINEGIDSDGQINGQVLTSDINTIQILNLNGSSTPYNQKITNLKGIEGFTALRSLDCSNHLIGTLDLNSNTQLVSIHCEYNMLASIQVNMLTGLTTLSCHDNFAASSNPAGPDIVVSLVVDQCLSLTNFDASNYPNLVCIQVNNAASANAGMGIYASWKKDPTAFYSEHCN
ncbi:MAG: hypothetical protein H6574_20850 [Lewinellaceae bacterium]|nr:hypothetical protein [Saprospiraceae bacterium]MCB9333516.1 hypothetical protein [Lewinellaceae bacterium]